MKRLLMAGVFLFTGLFHHSSLAGLSKETATETESISQPKPKIAYTILHNIESNEFCYVSAFDRKDIVPDFADPASYEEALSIEKPSVKQCSDEEVALISSYSTSSVLLDEDGIKLAGGGVLLGLGMGAVGVCALSSTIILWDKLDGILYEMLGAAGLGTAFGAGVAYFTGKISLLLGSTLGGAFGAGLIICGFGLGYGLAHAIYHIFI